VPGVCRIETHWNFVWPDSKQLKSIDQSRCKQKARFFDLFRQVPQKISSRENGTLWIACLHAENRPAQKTESSSQ
jgi:hypothetical protein